MDKVRHISHNHRLLCLREYGYETKNIVYADV